MLAQALVCTLQGLDIRCVDFGQLLLEVMYLHEDKPDDQRVRQTELCTLY